MGSWGRCRQNFGFVIVVFSMAFSHAILAASKGRIVQFQSEAQVLAQANSTQTCKFEALKKLGWNISIWDQPKANVVYGQPCDRENLAKAKDAGDMTLQLPGEMSTADLRAVFRKFDSLLRHRSSQCGYKMLTSVSLSKGIKKLIENNRYVFESGADRFCILPSEDWKSLTANSDHVTPTVAPSKAVESFYTKACSAECCLGAQVGFWSGQYELYGPKDFDIAFQPKELSMGTWSELQESKGILSTLVDYTKKTELDEEGKWHAKMGKFSFIGLTGAFQSVKKGFFLDAKGDHNENFIIVEMSGEAADQIRFDKGLSQANILSRKVWELSTRLPEKLRRNGDLLLGKVEIPADILPLNKFLLESVQALLNDPFLKGTRVYVHDLKEMSFAEHVVRQIEINPRTPYRIRFYTDIDLDLFYQRYLDHMIAQCLQKA